MPNETAVEYLASAPRVCQTQPMHWTFLEAPPDGTVMLTWQPLNRLGNNFASDGYIWADQEQAFVFECRGYVCSFAKLWSKVDLLTYEFHSPLKCTFTAADSNLQMSPLHPIVASATASPPARTQVCPSPTHLFGSSTTPAQLPHLPKIMFQRTESPSPPRSRE